jgi:hypothetical protein
MNAPKATLAVEVYLWISWVMILASRAEGAGTITATFENFAEGQNWSLTMTDPLSGIVFSEPTALGQNFIIEYGGARDGMPTILPGHYLKSNGHVPGDGIAIAPNTGFKATLPNPTHFVSLDFAYVGPGSLTLQALDDLNQVIATATVTPPDGFFLESHITLSTGDSTTFRAFRAIPTLGGGYDNITFDVPEPNLMFCMATAILPTTLRRRR